MRSAVAAALVACVLAAALTVDPARALAEPTAGLVAALLGVADADPLELARVVERFGEAPVRALLAQPANVAACLAAVRAAPMLRRPELALAALVRLSEGRDSLLAPAASRAALAIASRLDADTLAAREVLGVELAGVRAGLLALAARVTAGADVRLHAGAAAEALAAAGIP